MTTLLMCSPQYFTIDYEINPWMSKQKPVDKKKANQQWQHLHETLLKTGAHIELIEPQPNLPDMVFTANAALIYQNQSFIAHFHHPERQQESQYFEQFFKEKGYITHHHLNGPTFEGAGDALFVDQLLFIATGFRSDPCYAAYLNNILPQLEIHQLQLISPDFYHLDTCFCPIGPDSALVYFDAFDQASQKLLKQKLNCIAVSKDEAYRFACNAVVVDNHIIISENCPLVSEQLENKNFITHPVNLSEFLKAGGGAKCLTLKLKP